MSDQEIAVRLAAAILQPSVALPARRASVDGIDEQIQQGPNSRCASTGPYSVCSSRQRRPSLGTGSPGLHPYAPRLLSGLPCPAP